MLKYKNKTMINGLNFDIDKCRVKLDLQILKNDEDIIAKYIYIISSSLLNNLKSRSLIKGHSRLINKYVLKSYMLKIFYSKTALSNKMFDKMWEVFISSQFVTFSKTNYCQILSKREAIFNMSDTVYSNAVMLVGKLELQKFTLSKFTTTAISLLYSEPQIVQKGSNESTFISQEKVANHLGITQGAVSSAVKYDKKIFVYEEITEGTYKTMKSAAYHTDSSKFVTKIKDLSKVRFLVTNPIEGSSIKNPLSYISHKQYDDINLIQGVQGVNIFRKSKHSTPMNNLHEIYVNPKDISQYLGNRFEYVSRLTVKNHEAETLLGNVGQFRLKSSKDNIQKAPYKYYVLRGTKLRTKYTFSSIVLFTKKGKTKTKSFVKLVNDRHNKYKFVTTSNKSKVKLFANSYNPIKLDPEVRNYIEKDNMNSQALNVQIVSTNLKDSISKLRQLSMTSGKLELPTDTEIFWEVKQHLDDVKSLDKVSFPSNTGILLSKEISNMVSLVRLSTLSDMWKTLLINRLCLFSERNDIHTALI